MSGYGYIDMHEDVIVMKTGFQDRILSVSSSGKYTLKSGNVVTRGEIENVSVAIARAKQKLAVEHDTLRFEALENTVERDTLQLEALEKTVERLKRKLKRAISRGNINYDEENDESPIQTKKSRTK